MSLIIAANRLEEPTISDQKFEASDSGVLNQEPRRLNGLSVFKLQSILSLQGNKLKSTTRSKAECVQ